MRKNDERDGTDEVGGWALFTPPPLDSDWVIRWYSDNLDVEIFFSLNILHSYSSYKRRFQCNTNSLDSFSISLVSRVKRVDWKTSDWGIISHAFPVYICRSKRNLFLHPHFLHSARKESKELRLWSLGIRKHVIYNIIYFLCWRCKAWAGRD